MIVSNFAQFKNFRYFHYRFNKGFCGEFLGKKNVN